MRPLPSNYRLRLRALHPLGGGVVLLGDDALTIRRRPLSLRESLQISAPDGPTLTLQSRHIGALSTTWDVRGPDGEPVGAAQRRGYRSLFRDDWVLLDPDGAEVARATESRGWLGALRRVLAFLWFLPRSWRVSVDGAPLGTIRQRPNPLTLTLDVELPASDAPEDAAPVALDPRLGLALAALLLLTEGERD